MDDYVWCPIAINTIFLIINFFGLFNIRAGGHFYTEVIYLRKYLIKKSSRLNVLYFGTECRYDKVPRLLLQTIEFLLLFFSEILLLILALAFILFQIESFLFASNVVCFLAPSLDVILMIFDGVELSKDGKKEKNLSIEEYEEFKKDIEEEWPGFFCTSKRKKKKR